MKKLNAIVVRCFGLGLVLCLAATGCKQGRGERCQTDDDCAEGNCSESEPKVCGGENASQLDADIPIDAAVDGPI